MIYRHEGSMRPVRGWTNPEYRMLWRNKKQSRRERCLFKSASMGFCGWLYKDPEAGESYLTSSRHRGQAQRSNYRTSRRSQGVCKTAEKTAAARGNNMGYRANQAVWPRKVVDYPFVFAVSRTATSYICIFLCLSVFLSAKTSRVYQADTRGEENISVKHGRDCNTWMRWMNTSSKAGHLGFCFGQKGTVALRW